MTTSPHPSCPSLPGDRVDRLLALVLASGMGATCEQALPGGLQLLPAQVEDGLRVQADEHALRCALEPLLDQVLHRRPTGATLQWRAIRQGARACISLRVLPAADIAWALHVWLPLAANDPRHPEPVS